MINFQGSRAQRLIDEFEEGETIADGIARVLEHLAYAFDVVCDAEGESLVGVPVSTLDDLAVELRDAPQPEPEGPTDEELRELWQDSWDTSEELGAFQFARAVLARWGRHAPPPADELLQAYQSGRRDAEAAHEPPAEGEGRDIAVLLSVGADCAGGARLTSAQCRCAAALLSRPSPPQPIPVSERLPGDALSWWYEPDEDDDPTGYGGNWTLLRIRGNVSFYTHWLPAHALPVPTND